MSSIVPRDPETMARFEQILALKDKTLIKKMKDRTDEIDMNFILDSIDDAAKKWLGNQDARIPGLPMDRKELWGVLAASSVGTDETTSKPIFPVLQEFLAETDGEGKLAIDLGCGQGPAIKCMLQKGWRIIAVDNSRPALDVLAQQNKAALESGQLQIVEDDITEYTPPETADLVIAADSLPYINPSKFYTTWNKIHDVFVKEKGFFIGSLFLFTRYSVQNMNFTKELGAWMLPHESMVETLLTNAGYDIKTCVFTTDRFADKSSCKYFIAQKIEIPKKS